MHLDFPGARLNDFDGDQPLEAVRLPPNRNAEAEALKRQALEAWMKVEMPRVDSVSPNPIRRGRLDSYNLQAGSAG
jgi:hypothetical protein